LLRGNIGTFAKVEKNWGTVWGTSVSEQERSKTSIFGHRIVVRVHQLDAHDGGFDSADDHKNQGVKDVENVAATGMPETSAIAESSYSMWS
jgi:hypothetical protein